MRALLRSIRRLLTGLGFIVLLVAAVVTGVLWLTLPPRSQQARIPGLSGPVDIGFDADGIPRIRAASDTDAAAALGFVHARDRLFQMDLMRRAASGRLSEIAGPATLALRPHHAHARPAAARGGGLPGAARRDPRHAGGLCARRERLDRRARPVQRAGVPVPRRARTVGAGGQPAVGRDHGAVAVAQLAHRAVAPGAGRPRPAADDRRAVAAGERRRPARSGAGRPPLRRRRRASLPPCCRGSRTRTRCPAPRRTSGRWTAATPPPARRCSPAIRIWRSAFPASGTWRGSRRRDGVLAGATAPGVPFLVLGHNGHIAWTFTTTGADVQDVFIETPAGDGQYQTPDGPRPFIVREERIKVRGEPDQMLTVRETRHGPVISDLTRQRRADPGGRRWPTWRRATPPPPACSRSTRRRTSRPPARPPRMITSPVQNLLVADRADASRSTSPAGCRSAAPATGRRRCPGDGSHDWIGWASGEQLPHIVAPASGRLVNANDRVAPPDFPVFLGRDWFGDWRAAPHPRAARPVGSPHRGRLRPHAGGCAFTASPARSCRCCSPCRSPRTPPGAPRRCCATGTAA